MKRSHLLLATVGAIGLVVAGIWLFLRSGDDAAAVPEGATVVVEHVRDDEVIARTIGIRLGQPNMVITPSATVSAPIGYRVIAATTVDDVVELHRLPTSLVQRGEQWVALAVGGSTATGEPGASIGAVGRLEEGDAVVVESGWEFDTDSLRYIAHTSAINVEVRGGWTTEADDDRLTELAVGAVVIVNGDVSGLVGPGCGDHVAIIELDDVVDELPSIADAAALVAPETGLQPSVAEVSFTDPATFCRALDDGRGRAPDRH